MYEPIAVNSRYRRSVRLDFILYSHRTSSSKFLSYTSPAIEPCPHGSVPTDHGRTTVDDGRPRSRLLRRLYCTTLMSSTVDNVCIHVHIGTSILVDRSEDARSTTAAICTPVNNSPHGHTRRRAEGIIIPRATMPISQSRKSHKSYTPANHVHHVFFGHPIPPS